MSYAAEEKAIHERLAANWTMTPIKYGDAAFTVPNGTEWVAVFIQSIDARQIDLGIEPAFVRHESRIVVQVFGPQTKGTRLLKTYGDSIAAIFARQTFQVSGSGTIQCRAAALVEQPSFGGWAQVNVEILFKRDKRL